MPGPDGIPYELYDICFDIIGEDMCEIFNNILKNKITLSEEFTAGIITLIPKKPRWQVCQVGKVNFAYSLVIYTYLSLSFLSRHE